jgi:ParB family transcriptional regulator, chromosome partitioning protein
MDSPNLIKSDSANLLLNEIDILLAQMRLLELYLKQSQATAANETARIHEQYQAELKRLSSRPALGDNEQPAGQTTLGVAEQNRRDSALQSDLREKQRLLESRDIELQNASSETAILRGRIAELEMARHQAQAVEQEFASNRQNLQVEVAALRHQLETKQADFEKQQLISRALQESLEEQLAQLENQLTERQSTLEGVAAELRHARIEISAFQSQIAELQTSRHEAQARAARELEQTRGRFEAEIAGLQISLAERDRALEEDKTAIADVERSLKTDMLALRSQLEQKQELVEFRDDELRDAHRQLAALQQRVTELESADQSAAANAEEVERIRSSFEGEVTALQREVAARTRALNELREAVTATELALRGEIQTLQQEQARSRGMIKERENELHSSRAEVAGLRERIGQLEAAAAADLTTRQLGEETRLSLEAELTSLHSTLAQKEYALKEQQNFFQSVEHRLGGEITQLRSELAEQRTAADANNTELERLRSEIVELGERNAQAELARRQLDEARQQAGAQREELESRLQAKEHELRVAEASAQEQKEAALREQKNQFKSAEEQLRTHLEEQLRLSNQGNAELERLRSEITALQEQSTQSELSRRQLEEHRQHAEAQNQELQARMHAKEHELRGAEANAQEQKETALREQEILFRAVEERLAAEINQLRTQLEEQYGLSGQGNAELERLRSEIAEFQDRNEQSERSGRELEENWRRALTAEQELRTSLLAKEDELRAAQTKDDEFKHQFETAISQLQLQLTETGLLAASRVTEIGNLQADINRLSEQLAQRESAEREAQASFQKEIELNRSSHEAEMTAAYQQNRSKQQELETELEQERQAAVALRNQMAERERLFDDAQAMLKNREQDFAAAAAEAATLQARLHELEAASQAEAARKTESDQALSLLETELISIRSDLQQKNWAVAQQQATMENLAQVHRQQIQNLEVKLAEQQHGIKDRNLDLLERTQSQSRALQRRIEDLETELQRAQLEALSRVEQTTQNYAAQIEDLNFQLAQKTHALQERDLAGSNIENTLRGELDRLVRESEERNQILQNRNDELVRVKAEMDSLQERFMQLELSTSQTQSALAGESERIHTEFQARLALLQAELSQKEWALEERHASANTVEQKYRQEIEELRQKLADKEVPAKADRDEFVLGHDRMTDEQQERLSRYREVIDQVTSGPSQSFPASEGRRWRTGFSWKRRWKS